MKQNFDMFFWGLTVFIFLILSLSGCESYQEPDIKLIELPRIPALSVVQLKSDSNRIVVGEKSDLIFDCFWSAFGASLERTKKEQDTFYFPRAGRYNLLWSSSFKGGAGTGQQQFFVYIPKDAVTPCMGLATLLTGGCDPTSKKCWTFSKKTGDVTVGPMPGPAGIPRIELPEGAFLGVWDASNIYDLVRLT